MVLDLVILLVVGLMPLTQAIAYLQYTSWLPAELPAACSAALTADLDCDSGVNGLLTGCYHPESVLNNLCTTDCNTALNKYESSVVSACGAHTYASNTSQGDVPVSTIPQLLRYYYNYTCLTSADGAGFCNVIFANEIGINANQSNLSEQPAFLLVNLIVQGRRSSIHTSTYLIHISTNISLKSLRMFRAVET